MADTIELKGIMPLEGETRSEYINRTLAESRELGERIDAAIAAARSSNMREEHVDTINDLRAAFFIRTGMLMATLSKDIPETSA